jgi:hypothetical protein
MADANTSRNPPPAVPRIRPVIPLGFSRQPKANSAEAASPATPPKQNALLQEQSQALPKPPLTPESTPSNENARPGVVTPADSNSDALPGMSHATHLALDIAALTYRKEVNNAVAPHLNSDAAIASPPASEPLTTHSDTLDPTAHFVPPGVTEYHMAHTSTGGYYPMDGQTAATYGYPMTMMPMGYLGYHPAPAYSIPYHDNGLVPPVLNGHAAHHANEATLSRSDSHSSLGNDGLVAQSSASRANRSSISSAANGLEQVFQVGPTSLSGYMVSKFCTFEFADFMLTITSNIHPSVPPTPIHGLILARSPALRYLLLSLDRQNAPAINGLPVLQVFTDDKFITPHQLLLGISHLYGQPLPNFESMAFVQPKFETMSSALGFAAVGRFLQIPHLMSHGTKTAAKCLVWETVDKALGFVYEGNVLGASPNFLDRENWAAIADIGNDLLRSVVQFLAFYFPMDFTIHGSAAELAESPRLPIVIESRPSISHTRLASIQFGEVSAEDSAKFDTSVLLSSILISMPTQTLQSLFDSQLLGGKLGWAKMAQILRDTVEERERRRIKVRKTPPKRVVPGATAQQWDETLWEERVEKSEHHPTGLVIQRVHVSDDSAQG